ncbi:TetR/AcrR family transcriptional regulator [Castellaniella sp.]|uniref:TetR/AcrR family transcriptional regulator n=1 Tax=Castellaniella sp. TaxID=1955812 RepID=UPI002B000907|nr:TetR/AcrR family transcriptional regulator [Castellaniella sp.]
MTLSRSTLTRDAILDAAEHLFAGQGHDKTSMRQITKAAGVNLSAVNYHFGSKDALIEAVFQRRLTDLNDERLAILDALEAQAHGQPLKPSAIVEAYFGPLVRHACSAGAERRAFIPLQSTNQSDPNGAITALFEAERSIVAHRFTRALLASLPGVPETEIVWRFHFMLGATAYAIMGAESSNQILNLSGVNDLDAPALLSRLMAFLLGGLRAPLPAQSVSANKTSLSHIDPATTDRPSSSSPKGASMQANDG